MDPFISRRHALSLLTTALLLTACAASGRRNDSPSAARSAPSLGPAKEQIPVEDPGPGEVHLVYDLEDRPELWLKGPEDELIATYRAKASKRLSGRLSQRDLLLHQRAIFAAIDAEWTRGEIDNATLLLEGQVGSIGQATCLESLLFCEQARRYPIIEHPTEFGVFILRAKGRVRIYFSSMDRVGMKIRGEVTSRIGADKASGFEVTAHLHNHSFMFDRVPGDRMWTRPETVADVGGTLAPSTNDVKFYRSSRENEGLLGAWVTNGLDTARFSGGDFDRLTAAA